MKVLVIVLVCIVAFAVQVNAQQPRTIEQIQAEFSQLQAVYNNHEHNYNRGMDIVERSMVGMESAKNKMQILVEEAKQIQASKPEVKAPENDAPVK